MTDTAWPALGFNSSALLPPGCWGESYTVALLPLWLTGALRPNTPLWHGTACRRKQIDQSATTCLNKRFMLLEIHSESVKQPMCLCYPVLVLVSLFLTLLGSIETRLFFCIFYDRKSEFQVVHGDAMAIINVILTDRKQAQYMLKGKRKNVACQWSRLLPWFKKINTLDPAFIWNWQLFTKIYLHQVFNKKTLQLIETRLLFFGNFR